MRRRAIPLNAAAEKLASCRRELESVERQRAEAEGRRGLRASQRGVLRGPGERAGRGWTQARRKNRRLCRRSWHPLRHEAHRVSDSLAEAKLAAATLGERTTYAERVRDARVRDLETLAAASEARRAALPEQFPPPASDRCSPSSTS